MTALAFSLCVLALGVSINMGGIHMLCREWRQCIHYAVLGAVGSAGIYLTAEGFGQWLTA